MSHSLLIKGVTLVTDAAGEPTETNGEADGSHRSPPVPDVPIIPDIPSPLSPMALRHIACKVKAGETEREAEAEPQAVKASRRW